MLWESEEARDEWMNELAAFIRSPTKTHDIFNISDSLAYHFQWCDFTLSWDDEVNYTRVDRLELLTPEQYLVVPHKRTIQTRVHIL